MPIFYLPPPPFIGGRQPHDPGRKVTPPQAPPNPGFGHPTRLRPAEEITIRQAWEPPFPGWIGGQQPYDPGRRVTPPVAPPNPPFGHPTRLRPNEEFTIAASWVPGPPQPQQRLPVFTPGQAVSSYIPPPDTWLSTVIQAWQPGPPQPVQLPQKTIQAPPNPPFGSPLSLRPWQQIVRSSWDPGPPQPTQLEQLVRPPTPADNPPFSHPGRDVEKYIRTFDPELWRRSDHTGTDANPPPPVPDQPPPYQNWAQRYAIVYEAQELVYTIQLPTYSEILPEIVDTPPVIGVDTQSIIRRHWEPPFQYPQVRVKIVQPFHADAPPQTSDVLINILVQSWNVPWWGPPQPTKLLQLPAVADQPPPYSHVLLDTLIASWNVPWWGPAQPQKLTPPQAPPNPPPYSTVMLQQMAQLWQPGPPAPWQGYRYFQIPNAVVDNPPFPGISSQNVIRMAWEPGPPQPVQKPPLQTISGIEPPPVPPEEPPKTGGAPIYWYGSSTAYRIDTDDPIQREIKRKARERLGRIEIGLLENEKAQEVIEARIEHKIVEETRKATVKGRVDTSKVAKKVAADVKDDIRELRRLKRIQELEEEELEVILIFLSVDMNG